MSKEYATQGSFCSKGFVVEEDMLASEVGSGDAAVLATPVLINLMERLSAQLLQKSFDDETMTSVGSMINVKHMAPTPAGMHLMVQSTIVLADRNRFVFHVEASDEKEPVAIGIHERVVVQKERFEEKANQKLEE